MPGLRPGRWPPPPSTGDPPAGPWPGPRGCGRCRRRRSGERPVGRPPPSGSPRRPARGRSRRPAGPRPARCRGRRGRRARSRSRWSAWACRAGRRRRRGRARGPGRPAPGGRPGRATPGGHRPGRRRSRAASGPGRRRWRPSGRPTPRRRWAAPPGPSGARAAGRTAATARGCRSRARAGPPRWRAPAAWVMGMTSASRPTRACAGGRRGPCDGGDGPSSVTWAPP